MSKQHNLIRPVFLVILGIFLLFGCSTVIWGCSTPPTTNNNNASSSNQTTNENANKTTTTNANQNKEANTNNANTISNTTNAATENTATTTEENNSDVVTYKATINVKDYGPISVDLYGQLAPKTVENFVNLAQEGFYNGLTFHRIIDGFMIQGGDPLGNGTGGSDTTIVGEFTSNGFENDLSHERGVISMARSGNDPNSGSSQFFIVQADSPYLDGNYAGFGRVTAGMEIVDQICTTVHPIDSNGSVDPAEQPVIESITVEAVSPE